MSGPIPGVRYAYDAVNARWVASGRESLPAAPIIDNDFLPVRFTSVAQARAALGVPADANVVLADVNETRMLEEIFMGLGANDILALPERYDAFGIPRPWYIDSADGFRAAGVASISAPGGGVTPVVSTYKGQAARTWFSMARGRRGLIGLGPDVIVAPSPSSFSWPAQPYPQTVTYTSGTTGQLVGSQNSLLEFAHASPFIGNLTFRSRDLGGVSYSTVRASTAVRVNFDGSWRGFSGIPNGETGGLLIGNGAYRIENCTLTPNGGPSPIMWNRVTGGVVRNVTCGRPNHGMFTFWRCDGTNTFENVYMDANGQVLNLEEGGANFVINWTGGRMATQGLYHIIGESSGGSKKLNFFNVEFVGGGVAGALCTHFYTYTATSVQKRSDITRNNGPVSAVGAVIP